LLCLGYLDRARLRREEALAEARRLSPYTLSYALGLAWYGNSAIEGAESATKMLMSAKEILTISGEHGFPLFQGAGNIMHGWGLAALGRAAEGIPQFLEGLKICRGTGCSLLVPFWLTALADVYGKSSQPHEGLSQLAAAAELIDQTKERWAEPELHRVRGTLLAFLNRHDAAEQSYRLALEVARSLEAKFWELRAALDLARLQCQQGKFTEARDLLAPVYCWFTEGFDTPLLRNTKALLDQLV
jgi:predicted ATPase